MARRVSAVARQRSRESVRWRTARPCNSSGLLRSDFAVTIRPISSAQSAAVGASSKSSGQSSQSGLSKRGGEQALLLAIDADSGEERSRYVERELVSTDIDLFAADLHAERGDEAAGVVDVKAQDWSRAADSEVGSEPDRRA